MSIEFGVILVDSTSHALRIEKLINQNGLNCKLVPVPRHLSSDCGVCVRISKRDFERITDLLIKNQIFSKSVDLLE